MLAVPISIVSNAFETEHARMTTNLKIQLQEAAMAKKHRHVRLC